MAGCYEGIQSDVRSEFTRICIGVFGAGFLHTVLGRGPRNRTLHLYEVRPTNLLVFGFSIANAETSHTVRGWDLVVVTVVCEISVKIRQAKKFASHLTKILRREYDFNFTTTIR